MRVIRTIALTMLAGAISASSQAIIIGYDLQNPGSSTREYAFTVIDDSLLVDIEEFTVFFDFGRTENLSVTGSAGGWESLVNQPDPVASPRYLVHSSTRIPNRISEPEILGLPVCLIGLS